MLKVILVLLATKPDVTIAICATLVLPTPTITGVGSATPNGMVIRTGRARMVTVCAQLDTVVSKIAINANSHCFAVPTLRVGTTNVF